MRVFTAEADSARAVIPLVVSVSENMRDAPGDSTMAVSDEEFLGVQVTVTLTPAVVDRLRT